jgi:spore germination protein KC
LRIIKRLLLIACMLLLIFSLTACWSRVEINNRVFINGIFVDNAENGGVELTIAFPLPNRLTAGQSGGGAPTGAPYSIVTKQGVNLADAYFKIQSDLSKEINWGTAELIVLGKAYAEQGIGPILEFAAREPNLHLNIYMFVAPRKAKEISIVTPILERFPQEIIRKYARSRNTMDTTLKDCLASINYGGDIAIPMLTIGKTTIKSEDKPNVTWVGNDNIALFRNTRMIGDIQSADRLGVMWLKNRMRNAVLTVPSPTDGKLMSFSLSRTQTKIKPIWDTDAYRFRVTVNAQFMLISSESSIDVKAPEEMKKVESVLEKEIQSRMEGAFKKSKQIGADNYQLGEYLKIYYPSKWKKIKADWQREYQNKAMLETIVDVKIRRNGAEKKPIWIQISNRR